MAVLVARIYRRKSACSAFCRELQTKNLSQPSTDIQIAIGIASDSDSDGKEAEANSPNRCLSCGATGMRSIWNKPLNGRVGVVGVGLDTYWTQFDGLYAAMKQRILDFFDTPDAVSYPLTVRLTEKDLTVVAKAAVALESFIRTKNLDGLAYYYEAEPGSDMRRLVTNLIVGNPLLTSADREHQHPRQVRAGREDVPETLVC